MLVNAVPAAIVGCGMTFVIVTGEIDISVGSLMGLCAAAMGLLASPSHAGMSVMSAVLITIAIAGAVGMINGFLVTLAMLSILFGINKKILHGEWITDLPGNLRHLAIGTLGGVPIPLYVAAAVLILSS